MDTDRQTAAALLLAHAALVAVGVAFNLAMALSLTVQTLQAWTETHDRILVGVLATVGGFQALTTVGTVMTALFEVLAAVRTFRGEGRSLRTAAALATGVSVAMVPASLLTCSICAAMYWPLLIVVAAAALMFAQRADPLV